MGRDGPASGARRRVTSGRPAPCFGARLRWVIGTRVRGLAAPAVPSWGKVDYAFGTVLPIRKIFFCCLLALFAGCSREPEPVLPAPSPQPGVTAETVALDRGAKLFAEHCAQCHGPDAQGHPDWQTPNDGTFSAAPPLDGVGPAKGRTKQELLTMIKQGVRKDGMDLMPGYGRRLSDQEIAAIMSWFQSLWPPEVYEGWLKANGQSLPPQS